MKVSETDEFKKDVKFLSKKYRTLEQDLRILYAAIRAEPRGDGTKHWNMLSCADGLYVMKVRMMCRSVRGADFRVIYLYDGNKLELLFIELYFKGDAAREDRGRIAEALKLRQS